MVEDTELREVRAAREAYAQLHHFDVRAMVADLQSRNLAGDWPLVRCSPRRCQIRTNNQAIQDGSHPLR